MQQANLPAHAKSSGRELIYGHAAHPCSNQVCARLSGIVVTTRASAPCSLELASLFAAALQIAVAGPFQTVTHLMHSVLGFAHLQRYSPPPLWVRYQRGAVPMHPVPSLALRRLFQVSFQNPGEV